jgi:hypothetical protein
MRWGYLYFTTMESAMATLSSRGKLNVDQDEHDRLTRAAHVAHCAPSWIC